MIMIVEVCYMIMWYCLIYIYYWYYTLLSIHHCGIL